MALPIPLAAPVMMADLLVSFIGIVQIFLAEDGGKAA
jgi:hypothetical protein